MASIPETGESATAGASEVNNGQFERDLTHERTMDGLAAARARGRRGGRPKIESQKIQQAMAMYDANNIPIKDIPETTGISRATLYSYLKARKK